MSIVRPCICPMIVARGADQTPLTTQFEHRNNDSVVRNYGMLLVQLCATVPDGIVAFFPSYSYMETIIAKWHEMGLIPLMQVSCAAVRTWCRTHQHNGVTTRGSALTMIAVRLQAHKLLFIETKDIVETTLSLNSYKRACDVGRGAVFLSVARGKVAEGIDFDRHYGRECCCRCTDEGWR